MITKAVAQAIADDANAALAAVAEKHGLAVTYRGGSYSPDNFTAKFDFKTADADANTWALYCRQYGLAEGDLGKEFAQGGKKFRVSGVSPKSWKRPILAVELDGAERTFKFAAEYVARQLHPADEVRVR